MQKLFLLIIFTIQVYSHPHIFIEVKPTVYIKNMEIDKLFIKWILDEMSSIMLIMEFDNDANGIIDKNENNYIYKNYFSSLKKQNFYIKILSKEDNILINPKNFKASIEDSKLIYSFEIDQIINTMNLKIYFDDEDLFVGMILKKDYIKLSGIDNSIIDGFIKKIFGIN